MHDNPKFMHVPCMFMPIQNSYKMIWIYNAYVVNYLTKNAQLAIWHMYSAEQIITLQLMLKMEELKASQAANDRIKFPIIRGGSSCMY